MTERIAEVPDTVFPELSHAADFCFLGAAVRIATDDPAVLTMFRAMYGRFEDDRPDAHRTVFRVVTRPTDGTAPFVAFHGKVEPLIRSELLASHAYMVILNQVLREIGGHYMIHAGAVARAGGAMLLLGGSGFGKTTLILKLLSRGFALLSDEFACVSRADGLVHPFPRAMGIRETAFPLFPGLAEASLVRVKNIGRGHKYLLDALALPDVRLSAPVPVSHVLVLDAGTEAVPEGFCLIDVALRDPLPELHDRLGMLDGVALETTTDHRDYAVWRYRVALDTWEEFARVCEEARPRVLYYERIFGERPDFSRPVEIRPMRKSEAAQLLLRNLRNRMGCFGGEEGFRKNASRTYMELVRLVRPTRCAQLVMGDLDEVASRIERTADEPDGWGRK